MHPRSLSNLFSGCKPLSRRLIKGAIPSKFSWTVQPSPQAQKRQERADRREENANKKLKTTSESSKIVNLDLPDIGAEVECAAVEQEEGKMVDSPKIKEGSTQTQISPGFCVEKYMHNPAGMCYYTGLESFEKFLFVLDTLGPGVDDLIYYYKTKVYQPSVRNQFFLTLVKLRRGKDNFELSDLFQISETTVTNIFITWVNFMYLQWGEVNLWAERNVVSFNMPSDFKRQFPRTRVVVDGTEFPIKKPSAPLAQQATFSTYKNRNTAKILVGVTPGGMVSYVSPAYGGSTSDRQIVERSDLPQRCDPGDIVLADKGFKVQDLFAPYDITVNHPTFFDKKNRLSGDLVMKDRKIASKRVHVERVIGQAKTYQILKKPLTATETKLATQISTVCFTLTNFKTCIVPKHA